MKATSEFPKILLYRHPTDMRKQSPGLSILVEQILQEDPFSDCLFVFCNRRRDLVKALYFDRAGFCLWIKKLDQSRFPWPSKTDPDKVVLTAADFDLLLDGVDVLKRHKKLNFSSVS